MTCGKKILIVLAAALAVAGPAYAITGGTPDGQGHPAVGLLLADAGPAGFQPDCSGALVAPDVFVTAAHCFIGTASNHVLITFDTQASPSSKFVPGIAYPDPAFNTDKKDLHDLAVVKLLAPVAGVTPLSLPKAGVVDSPALKSAQLTNVGYGYFDRTFVFDGIRRVVGLERHERQGNESFGSRSIPAASASATPAGRGSLARRSWPSRRRATRTAPARASTTGSTRRRRARSSRSSSQSLRRVWHAAAASQEGRRRRLFLYGSRR